MISKRSGIVILVGLNLLLAALLVVGTYSPPAAFALSGGRGGDFACITAKTAGQNYDVVYVLDQAADKLHAFHPESANRANYTHGGFRDLRQDFGEP